MENVKGAIDSIYIGHPPSPSFINSLRNLIMKRDRTFGPEVLFIQRCVFIHRLNKCCYPKPYNTPISTNINKLRYDLNLVIS